LRNFFVENSFDYFYFSMYVFPQKILVKDKPTIKYLLTIAKLPIIGEELWKNSHPTPMFLSHPLEDNKF
jgi:hypothetical protein